MSVQAIPRDYSLSGGHQDAVELDDDRIVERMDETWWKPKLSRQQMREIMQRRDGPALWHYSLWFALLAASAPTSPSFPGEPGGPYPPSWSMEQSTPPPTPAGTNVATARPSAPTGSTKSSTTSPPS